MSESHPRRLHPAIVAGAGLLAMLVAMGIGRFGYTALLPQMREDGLLGLQASGVLAASNYLGYLIGALWAAFSRQANAGRRLAASLILSALTTAMMALDLGIVAWNVVRLVSGIASAMVYIYATGIVLRYLSLGGHGEWSALHFVGVGAGISLSAWIAQQIQQAMAGSPAGWLAFGAASAICGGLAICGLLYAERAAARDGPGMATAQSRPGSPPAGQQSPAAHGAPAATGQPSAFTWLALSYGLAGLGYIVNATFLPLMLRGQAGLADSALTGWLWVGLSAIPATVVWFRLGKRTGIYTALMLSTALQAVGVALPVLQPGHLAAMTGAILLGGTFMGISGLAQLLVRTSDAQQTAQRIGVMTACYGTGQILGPLLAAGLASGDDFTLPVLIAAGALVLSLACLAVSRRREALEGVSRQVAAMMPRQPR